MSRGDSYPASVFTRLLRILEPLIAVQGATEVPPAPKTEAETKWSDLKSTPPAAAWWDWEWSKNNSPIKPQRITTVYRIVLDISVEVQTLWVCQFRRAHPDRIDLSEAALLRT